MSRGPETGSLSVKEIRCQRQVRTAGLGLRVDTSVSNREILSLPSHFLLSSSFSSLLSPLSPSLPPSPFLSLSLSLLFRNSFMNTLLARGGLHRPALRVWLGSHLRSGAGRTDERGRRGSPSLNRKEVNRAKRLEGFWLLDFQNR